MKSLIKKKFGGDSDAAKAIDKLEAKPDSEGRKQTLTEELKAVNAASEPELISAVQSLLELIKALPQGEKHIQFAQGTGIAQADRGSTATVTMHAPLKKEMTDNPHQSAYGTGIAQAYGEGATATVNITGLNPEQIASLLQAAGAAAQARIDELAGQLHTSREAVLGFLKILQEEEGPIEQLPAKLTLIAQRHVGMLGRLAALDPEDADAQSYIDEAREVLRQAASTKDYDLADELLSKAEEAQDRSLRGAEALEREAHDAASRIRHGKAATRAERGELSLTRLDYLQAAQHFQSAASLVAGEDLDLKLDYLTRSADALRTHGDEKGDNAVLAQAIGVYREVLRESTRERVPLDWAMTQNNLGNALRSTWGAGERDGAAGRGGGRLSRGAKGKDTRAGAVGLGDNPEQPGQRASDIGGAGERDSAAGRGGDCLSRGPKEYTRERCRWSGRRPRTTWAPCFRALGERESGTGRLEEAVTAYREALKEYTRERVPLRVGDDPEQPGQRA